MKHFTSPHTVIILISLLGLISCQKEVFLFMSTEEKIVGEWAFEKVEFRKEFSLGRNDVTSDYRNQSLLFKEDLSLIKLDLISEIESKGAWEVDCDYNANSETTTNSLIGSYLNTNSNEFILMNWENLRVNKNTLRATHRKDGGVYFFKLERK